ncbi:MAG TPA: FtsQ-type POTRA domain-containing protein [Microbacterium sp.]|uniref:FtsQ-type POTRA domain-containing protein n=1 Tax=Microbacterium sp. TaxID=51671 RepID=UPI002C526B46|nr:FtsQ-type POTRA domain-containing protein [Microbacterium sp.]HWI30434.1 FtsQ-type POTRA domain-containing protein [Microbacterium sp.]
MRRPSPLPVPEKGPDPVEPPVEQPETAAEHGDVSVDHPAVVEPDTATAPIGLPGWMSGDGPAGDAAGPATGSASGSAAGSRSEPDAVRLVDVWAASRARRKALRAEVRRFTVRARRRRAVWIGVAASLVVLVLGSVGAAYSPLFAVENIRVVGGEQLDVAAVEAALSDQIGTPLPLIDASAVKAALVAFPLIETYTLEARPPHDLVLRVVERTPIGVVESAAGFTLVDAAGVALSTTAVAPANQPVLTVRGGAKSDAFAAAGRVMRSLPDSIRLQVTAVAATSPDDVVLTLGGTNTQVVWGNAERSVMKALVLETTMVQRPPADVSVYDVSSPTAVVVR